MSPMTDESKAQTQDRTLILKHATEIVSGYLAQNRLSPQDLPGFIRQVHAALVEIKAGSAVFAPSKPVPAVDPKKSVHNDYIICLEDGVKMKSLKRHLAKKYNLSPQQYREKWGLPKDYPMVCRSYSKMRSEMAKKMGLGQGKASGDGKAASA
jgi:predicted transcriptional regulator